MNLLNVEMHLTNYRQQGSSKMTILREITDQQVALLIVNK